MDARVYITGAQKWHIVSLLGDVTSPTTVAYYVSITCSEHREALTAALTQTVYTYKRLEYKGEVHSLPLSLYGGFVTSQQRMGDRSISPQ